VTGGLLPLLAHAPDCPPRRPVENGASGKTGQGAARRTACRVNHRTGMRTETCEHLTAGRSHPPRENRPAAPGRPGPDAPGGQTRVTVRMAECRSASAS
jgi:hypothetical protein